MTVITLPAAALASSNMISFDFVRSQEALETNTGIEQITTFPNRKWFAQLQINAQHGAGLRAWSLALDQLSDLNNVVALSPPYYEGPSTGYAGANPLVNGASQLGQALAADGVPNTTAILLAGDFCSFDTVSALSNTNRQLIKVSANVTSNGSGQISLALVVPIRQSPANNATLNVKTPSAFFRLTTPRSSVQYQLGKRAPFVIDLTERIYP